MVGGLLTLKNNHASFLSGTILVDKVNLLIEQ